VLYCLGMERPWQRVPIAGNAIKKAAFPLLLLAIAGSMVACDLGPEDGVPRGRPSPTAIATLGGIVVEDGVVGGDVTPRVRNTATRTPTPSATPTITPGTPIPTATPTVTLTPFATPTHFATATPLAGPPTVTPRVPDPTITPTPTETAIALPTQLIEPPTFPPTETPTETLTPFAFPTLQVQEP
jgi:hypothetical protein